jgi:hypothetical protein
MMRRRDHLTGVVLGFLLAAVAAAEYLPGVMTRRPPAPDWVFGLVGCLGALMGIGSLAAFLKPGPGRVDPASGRPLDLAEYETWERAIVSSKTRIHGALVAGQDADFNGQPSAYIHKLACGHHAECRVHHMARIFCDDCYQTRRHAGFIGLDEEEPGDGAA